jgi:hypothetical protein
MAGLKGGNFSPLKRRALKLKTNSNKEMDISRKKTNSNALK